MIWVNLLAFLVFFFVLDSVCLFLLRDTVFPQMCHRPSNSTQAPNNSLADMLDSKTSTSPSVTSSSANPVAATISYALVLSPQDLAQAFSHAVSDSLPRIYCGFAKQLHFYYSTVFLVCFQAITQCLCLFVHITTWSILPCPIYLSREGHDCLTLTAP